jgi:homoserine dehydrogenase
MKEVRVGIAGFGTVGMGTAEALSQNRHEIEARTGAQLRVTAVCRRSPIPGEAIPRGARAVSQWKALVSAPDVDVVVEAIGGTTVAYEVVRAALDAGKPVVTANKNLIAEHGEQIFAIARQRNIPVGIEASVAGAVPIIRVLSESICGDRVLALRGILNGTANYILTRMYNDGLPFNDALALAQKAGYAEADPAFDVDGIDARDKLCILARLAFRCQLATSQIPTVGIRNILPDDMHYARRLNSTIRLIASAERHPRGVADQTRSEQVEDTLEVSVRPWLVSKQSMLSSVEGAHNAVLLEGERTGSHMLYGRGAGGGPTGVAVLSDLMQIAAEMAAGKLSFRESIAAASNGPVRISPQHRLEPWYLRLTVNDQPGIVAQVASAIAKQGANIDSVIQEPHLTKPRLSFVITIEPVAESAINAAIREINAMRFMIEPVLVLPIQDQ